MQKGIEFVTSDYKKDQFRKDETVLKSHVDEAKSLNYEDKIGSTKISLSKEKIIFGNKTLLTKDIQAIRYGIYVHSTNGIKDSQSYKIWLWDGKSTTEIECAKGLGAWSDKAEKKYHAILGSLYQTVQSPLITKMIDEFEKNGSVALGGIVIDYTGWHRSFSYDPISKGVISLSSKIFKTRDADTLEDLKKNLSWTDYGGYNRGNGQIFIFREVNKKNEMWTTFNVRDDWNAVNLIIFLDYLHKDGKLWRIIKTKPFEKNEKLDHPAAEPSEQKNKSVTLGVSLGRELFSFLKQIPWWVWLLGGIFLYSSLSSSGGSSSTSSGTSKSYQSTSAPIATNRNQITNLKSEIAQKEQTLLSMRTESETEEKQLAEYQNSIKRIESTYTSANIPTNTQVYYDNIINMHNALLEKYNQLIATYNQLHDSYKEDIKKYNNLVDEYNQRARNG